MKIFLTLILTALVGAAQADELADLIKELKVPARFAGHKAQFSVEQREFT